VNHLDTCGFEFGQVRFRVLACGLDYLDTGTDHGIQILPIGRRLDGRQNGQVDAKGLIRHQPAAGNFLIQRFRAGLGKAREYPQPASVGDCGGQLGAAYPHHAALHNGVANPQ